MKKILFAAITLMLISHSQERLNLENIKPGIYLIKAFENTNQEFVKLFFKL